MRILKTKKMSYESNIKAYPTIAVNTSNGVVFLQENEILYCKAEGSYTHLYLKGIGRNKLVVAKSLNKVLPSLSAEYFVRIHNSFIINLLHLTSFNGPQKNCVTMADGSSLAVSRARKEAFMNRFRKI